MSSSAVVTSLGGGTLTCLSNVSARQSGDSFPQASCPLHPSSSSSSSSSPCFVLRAVHTSADKEQKQRAAAGGGGAGGGGHLTLSFVLRLGERGALGLLSSLSLSVGTECLSPALTCLHGAAGEKLQPDCNPAPFNVTVKTETWILTSLTSLTPNIQKTLHLLLTTNCWKLFNSRADVRFHEQSEAVPLRIMG